jgi:hypothetical protein
MLCKYASPFVMSVACCVMGNKKCSLQECELRMVLIRKMKLRVLPLLSAFNRFRDVFTTTKEVYILNFGFLLYALGIHLKHKLNKVRRLAKKNLSFT